MERQMSIEEYEKAQFVGSLVQYYGLTYLAALARYEAWMKRRLA